MRKGENCENYRSIVRKTFRFDNFKFLFRILLISKNILFQDLIFFNVLNFILFDSLFVLNLLSNGMLDNIARVIFDVHLKIREKLEFFFT